MSPTPVTITQTLVDDQGNTPYLSPTTTLPTFVTYLLTGNSVAITIAPVASTLGGTYLVSFTTTDTVAS